MPPRIRTKICGITHIDDGLAAVAAGADAIGLVFYPPSKRAVSVHIAADIARAMPPLVTRVALFLDPTPAEVAQVLAAVEVDLLQFHGQEDAAFCTAWGLPYLKAVGMAGGSDVQTVSVAHPAARGLLLDGHAQGLAGGSGQRFDWSCTRPDLGRPWLLAGGLNADNVAAAIDRLHPYGVDVSSGVEQAPGRKDPAKLNAFMNEVRRVNCQ